MYPGTTARRHPDRPCIVMAGSGQLITYGELESRSNRLAHLFRQIGLRPGDHYAIYMENHPRYIECCAAGERSGLYYTCVNSYLTAAELAYVLQNSESQILITSRARAEVAIEAARVCPGLKLCLTVDGAGPEDVLIDLEQATRDFPDTAVADERIGTAMLYSSGTTGRPKGILRPLPDAPPEEQLPLFRFLDQLWRHREGMMYLSPAPLYHSAPQAAVGLTIRNGGTAVIMERFDAEHYLALVEKFRITHSQLVPTMFSRMLKLTDDVRLRYDVSSLEYVVHAAAPCPVAVKERMIEWWGPIISEYYGATEGLGLAACTSQEWLAHKGTVGKVVLGELHILDEAMNECPNGTPGTVWFKSGPAFEYFNDPARTAEARSRDGTMSTVGDVGYVDEEGYLYLTDRTAFVIISGGVNVYPQECENVLLTHPKVADAAVFGVPNPDLGEEVKAVVELLPGVESGDATAAELLQFCRAHLAAYKCPRSIDFEAGLPRLPTGKLYKGLLRDRYRGGAR